MNKRNAVLFVIGAFLLCAACAPEAPVMPAPTATATPAITATPAPTATPLPSDYDSIVDFGGQSALLSAVQYALASVSPDITYRMLDTVETLILSDAASITDVSVLQRAGNLSMLVIVDGEMDLSPLAALPKLTTLTVTGGHFGDLSRVAVLPQLTALNLFGYDSADFSPLLTMPNLTTLRIGNHAPCDFSQLAALTNLTTLMLPDSRGNDLNWLAELSNLTDLTIWQCKQRYFDFLPSLTKLERLRLDMRTDCDLTPVGTLLNLRELTIDMESGRAMDDQSWLGNLTKLHALSLRGIYFGNLARLNGLSDLTSLTLASVRDNIRLYELPELPQLTELNIYFNSVTNLAELHRFESLRKLTLYACSISDPRSVSELTNLTSLTMRASVGSDDRSLGDLDRIADLVNLEYLDWGGRATKPDALMQLRKLTHLRLANARIVDWTPLTKIPSLCWLDLSGSRVKRIPASVGEMCNLVTLDLSDCKNLHYIDALADAPSLLRLTLDGNRVRNPETLAARRGMTALSFVSGGYFDPLTGRHTGVVVGNPVCEELRLGASPYINGAEAHAVLDRFFLKDYMHEPAYCSSEWYPAFAPFA